MIPAWVGDLPGWRVKVARVVEAVVFGGHLIFCPHHHWPEGLKDGVEALSGKVDLPDEVVDVRPGG